MPRAAKTPRRRRRDPIAEAQAAAAEAGALPLPSEKREAFCRLVAGGVTQPQAYRQVGYRGVNAAQLSVQLATQPVVAARIAYLRAERHETARAASVVDAARVQGELEALAFSDVGDVFDLEGEGLRVLPMGRWPERARRAVQSVKVRRRIEGAGDDAREVELVEFRLWPKTDALRQLREHMGLVGPQGGLTLNNFGVVHLPALDRPTPGPNERILDVEVTAVQFSDHAPPPPPPATSAIVVARRAVAEQLAKFRGPR